MILQLRGYLGMIDQNRRATLADDVAQSRVNYQVASCFIVPRVYATQARRSAAIAFCATSAGAPAFKASLKISNPTGPA